MTSKYVASSKAIKHILVVKHCVHARITVFAFNISFTSTHLDGITFKAKWLTSYRLLQYFLSCAYPNIISLLYLYFGNTSCLYDKARFFDKLLSLSLVYTYNFALALRLLITDLLVLLVAFYFEDNNYTSCRIVITV